MDTIEKIRKRAELLQEARSMHDKAEEEKRDLTKEQESRFYECLRTAELLSTEIEVEEFELRTTQVLDPELLSCGGAPVFRDSALPKRHVIPGKTYRQLFGSQLDNNGFRTWKEFCDVMRSGRYDERLEKRQHITAEDILGGYSVPTEYAAWLVDKSLEAEIVRPRATVWQMASKYRKVPAWAGSSHVDGYGGLQLFGGFVPVWMDEASLQADQLAALRQVELEAHKLGLYTSVSSELEADGLDFDAQLSNAIIKAIGFTLDYYFLQGTGGEAGQPLGVLNDPALITVTRDTAESVVYDDIVNMISRLHPVAANNAIWIANHGCMPSLLTMVDAGNHLVWQPNARDGAPGNLLGYPLIRTEKLPALGCTGDLLLVDLSHYAVGIRETMTLERSNAPGWHQDLQSYRCLMRVDGQGTWDEPITPLEGAATLSWAVALGVAEGS